MNRIPEYITILIPSISEPAINIMPVITSGEAADAVALSDITVCCAKLKTFMS
jgi:hypothetical protein